MYEGKRIMVERINRWAERTLGTAEARRYTVDARLNEGFLSDWAHEAAAGVQGDLAGLWDHLVMVDDSILLRLEAAVEADSAIKDIPADRGERRNEEWVNANREFANAMIGVGVAIDLLGHMWWINMHRSELKDHWVPHRWEFKRSKRPRSAIHYWDAELLHDDYDQVVFRALLSEPNDMSVSLTLRDVVRAFRHKPVHMFYDYLVIRRIDRSREDQWVLVDPRLSVYEVMEARKRVNRKRPTKSKKAWDHEPGEVFFPRGESLVLTAQEIISSLVLYALQTHRSILNRFGAA